MADRLPAPQAASSPGRAAERRFLVFHVAGRLYALPGDEVSEIIRMPPVARLPHSPKSLMGLANLRGTIVPMIDTRSLLGRGTFAASDTARAIVTTGATPVALAVDTVDALVVPPADQVETRQAELAADPGERLRGAFRAPDRREAAPSGPRGAAPAGTGLPRALRRNGGAWGHAGEHNGDRTEGPRREYRAGDHARQPEWRPADPPDASFQQVAKILDLPAMLAAAFAERIRPPRAPHIASVPVAAGRASEAVRDERLLLSFDVAGQDYALPIRTVREVVPLPWAITVVPRAEAVLLGVIAYRDSLLPLLSLRGLLGFVPAESRDGAEKVVVVTVGDVLVGLVADGMRAIIRASPSQLDAAPAMLAARSGGESKIAAIFRGDGGRHLVSLLAPEQLFREDVMRRLGNPSGTMPLRPDAATRAPNDAPFVVFRLGDEEFALPVSAVDEVARVPVHMTRVPKTPDFLEGVINLRGEVLPVVDQRRRFDLPKFTGNGQRLIVVRTDRHRAGLIVDSVSEVLRCPLDAVRPAPDLAHDRANDTTADAAPLISGVIDTGATGRMILLFDPAGLLTRAERGVLDKLELDAAMPGAPCHLDLPENPGLAENPDAPPRS